MTTTILPSSFTFPSLDAFYHVCVADFVQEGCNSQRRDYDEYRCVIKNLGYLAIFLENEVSSKLENESAKDEKRRQICTSLAKCWLLSRMLAWLLMRPWKNVELWTTLLIFSSFDKSWVENITRSGRSNLEQTKPTFLWRGAAIDDSIAYL